MSAMSNGTLCGGSSFSSVTENLSAVSHYSWSFPISEGGTDPLLSAVSKYFNVI